MRGRKAINPSIIVVVFPSFVRMCKQSTTPWQPQLSIPPLLRQRRANRHKKVLLREKPNTNAQTINKPTYLPLITNWVFPGRHKSRYLPDGCTFIAYKVFVLLFYFSFICEFLFVYNKTAKTNYKQIIYTMFPGEIQTRDVTYYCMLYSCKQQKEIHSLQNIRKCLIEKLLLVAVLFSILLHLLTF